MTDYTTWPQRTMTQEAWDKTSSDYKSIKPDGVKTLLVLEKGMTTLAVVTITNSYSTKRGKRLL